MELALQTGVNGLALGAFYALVSVGFALVMGVMRVENIAFGELYMVGAYTVWLLYAVGNWPFPLAVLAAFFIVGFVGLVTERTMFRPMRGSLLGGFIMSVGLIFILQVLVGQIWGLGRMKPVPYFLGGTLETLGITIAWQKILIIPISFIALGALWYFLYRVKIGRAVRAMAQDPETATLMGISRNTIDIITLSIGSAFSGLGGALMAPLMAVHPYMGHSVILKILVVVILGGMGCIEGALVAALVLGFLDAAMTTIFAGSVADIIGFVFMLSVLAVRPRGLLNRGALEF